MGSCAPAYEKQQKRIKALKKSGKVTVDVSKSSSRDSATKQKQRAMVTATSKGKKGGNDSDEEDGGQEELLQPVKDYVVRLFFTSAGGTWLSARNRSLSAPVVLTCMRAHPRVADVHRAADAAPQGREHVVRLPWQGHAL